MPDLVHELTTHTGLSPEMIQRGLGALLSFIKTQLGDENFDKLKNSLPEASALTSRYESEPAPEGAAPAGGGLFDAISGLAGKLLGGKAGEGIDLLSTLGKLGFKPEQIQSFLPKALELIQAHVPPEILQKLLTSLPALAKLMTADAK